MSIKEIAERLHVQVAVVLDLKALVQKEGPLTYSELSEYAEGLLREAAKQAQNLPDEEPRSAVVASSDSSTQHR